MTPRALAIRTINHHNRIHAKLDLILSHLGIPNPCPGADGNAPATTPTASTDASGAPEGPEAQPNPENAPAATTEPQSDGTEEPNREDRREDAVPRGNSRAANRRNAQ